MKKFTKGCLMTALVLFLVGLVLSIVCGLLGGFRQLSEMGVSDSAFGLYRDADGGWRIGFPWSGHIRDELDDIEDIDVGDMDIGDIDVGDADIGDIEDIRKTTGEALERKLKELDGKKEQLALTADTLGSIEIDVEDCNVLIHESEDEYVWFLVEGNSDRLPQKPHYTIEDEGGKNRLHVENEVKRYIGHWRDGANDTVYLWLPKGCALEECDITMGAGYMGSVFLQAKQMKVDLGAGLVETDGFEGEQISILVGAGELLADRITAGKADFEIGAGHLRIDELAVSGETDVEVSMGAAEIAGTLSGDLDMECDMGEIVMRLTGSEDDHSYNVECGMGNVTVGNYSHSGLASHKSWNTGNDSEFDINCNMGNVTVTFEE